MVPIYAFDSPEGRAYLESVEQRTYALPRELRHHVLQILEKVKQEGDAALLSFARQFDGVDMTRDRLRVLPSELHDIALKADPQVIEALRIVAERIHRFHERQRPAGFTLEDDRTSLTLDVRPLDCVGVYIPGGQAAYPSTVLMTIIPAQVAGVRRIIVCTPPRAFSQRPVIAAALRLLGVEEVYRVGGPAAIAAMAYGTETVPRVDKIVGPGNVYVAMAKRLVYGVVDIDLIAGPTELLVLCDETAPPAWVAADLLSQAEHDEAALVLCFTQTPIHARAIADEMRRRVARLPTRATIEKALRHSAIIVFPSTDTMVAWANRVAPEHLAIAMADAEAVVSEVRHAGAVFVGPFSSVVFGDYWAGPNHVLPTTGAARYSSPLGVYDFVRYMSRIRIHPAALRESVPTIRVLAQEEGLPAHAAAAETRTEKE